MDGKSKRKEIGMVIGLGNPGREYEATFHNAGARFVEFLAATRFPDAKFSRHASGEFRYLKRAHAPILVRSLVFMNESGRAASRAARFFKVPPASVLIAHDDADIPLGEYRLAFDRGAAGHHGVESVAAAFRTGAFHRLRIGIRAPGTAGAREQASSFVLRRMTPADADALERAFADALAEDLLGVGGE